MTYAGQHVIAALKAARKEKGLTQRELSARAGVPQSHISKIETGSVNIQLSSLIELARVLGLEVIPVPRKLVPAVQTVIRSGTSSTSRQAEDHRLALKYLKRIRKNINHFRSVPNITKELLDLQRVATELEAFRLGARQLDAIRNISESLQKISNGPKAQQAIKRIASELRQLRNNLAHNADEAPAPIRPAYSLDEEQNDA